MPNSLTIPSFSTKKETFDWLRVNKSLLIESKKSEIKLGDSISLSIPVIKSETASKEDKELINKDEVKVTAVINTTNLIDSQLDVLIDGAWDKHLSTNPRILHLQEHNWAFDKVISEGNDLKTYTKTFTWKELGANYEGSTEALIFESTVKKSRNPFMFEQYSKGYVVNHSVGLQYVNLELAINDEEDKEHFEVWNKYIDRIPNKSTADQYGYFFAVTEAKVREGSAVVAGSNFVTPTLEVKEYMGIDIAKQDYITVESELNKEDETVKNDNKRKFNSDYVTFIKLKYNI